MPCHRKVCGRELDDVFGYPVPRDVIIKDGWVGGAFFVGYFVGIIMLFIKFYGWDRAYMAQGTVGGVARIQPLAPYPEWSSATLGLQQPYCTPGSLEQAPASNTSDVTIFPLASAQGYPTGMYTYTGKAVPNPIYPCLALDDRWTVVNPLETSNLFVPTRIVSYQEAAPYCSLTGTHTNGTRTIRNTTSVSCTYAASTSKTSYYVPDVEAYTLKLDHQLLVPNLSPPFVKGKDAMSLGALLDGSGNAVDPCAFYARRNPSAPCPRNSASQASRYAYISIGQKGVPDIVSIGSLLEAAGVSSLEALGDPLSSDSMRYGGVTLVLSVEYNNYWAPLATSESASAQVKYSYKVEAVQGKVKGIFGVSPTGAIPTTSRYIYEKSGLRVLMVFNGKIGQPEFTTTFVNLMTIFTTYTLGAWLAGIFIKHLLTFSPIYKQYITLTTHDLSHLRGVQSEVKAVLDSFNSNQHVLYPPPPLLANAGGSTRTLPACPTALHLGIPIEPTSATGVGKEGAPEAAAESSAAAAPLSAEQVSLSTAEGAAPATAPEPASAAVAGSAEDAAAPSGAAAPAKEGGKKSGQYADL